MYIILQVFFCLFINNDWVLNKYLTIGWDNLHVMYYILKCFIGTVETEQEYEGVGKMKQEIQCVFYKQCICFSPQVCHRDYLTT